MNWNIISGDRLEELCEERIVSTECQDVSQETLTFNPEQQGHIGRIN